MECDPGKGKFRENFKIFFSLKPQKLLKSSLNAQHKSSLKKSNLHLELTLLVFSIVRLCSNRLHFISHDSIIKARFFSSARSFISVFFSVARCTWNLKLNPARKEREENCSSWTIDRYFVIIRNKFHFILWMLFHWVKKKLVAQLRISAYFIRTSSFIDVNPAKVVANKLEKGDKLFPSSPKHE